MRLLELSNAIGKKVKCDRAYCHFNEDLRPLLTGSVILVRKRKDGLALVLKDGTLYAIPLRYIELIQEDAVC